MKKYEYRILNHSELIARLKSDKNFDFVSLLNEYGSQGWRLTFKLTESSYLLMREVSA